MGTKWADHVITRVRYNVQATHIEQVEVYDHDFANNQLINQRYENRATVVANRNRARTYVTATRPTTQSPFTIGAPVQVVTVNHVDYVRTDANATAKDNLGNLPTY